MSADRVLIGFTVDRVSIEVVYTQKRISTPLFFLHVSLARYKTIFIDFKQINIEQVVSQINKALRDIPVLSWWKETLEVNSAAYTLMDKRSPAIYVR